MRFTNEELAKIAAWAPISPGFDREDATIEANVRPILDRLVSDGRLGLRTTQDGGLSNYFAFLVFDTALERPPGGEVRAVPCVEVQLSLMAPVGVYGLSTFSESERSFGWSNLGPEQVCEPVSPPNWIAALVVAAVHEMSPYRLLAREVTDQPFPLASRSTSIVCAPSRGTGCFMPYSRTRIRDFAEPTVPPDCGGIKRI
jgi:hypothetical protein